MDVGVVSVGGRENIVVRRGIRNLLANMDHRVADKFECSAVNKTVDKRGVRILINLLNCAGELVGRLSPVVVLHRDHKHGLNFLGLRAESADGCQNGEHAQLADKT